MRVIIYSGIYIHHDAISNSVYEKVEALRALRNAGAPIDVTVVCEGTDRAEPGVLSFASPGDLLSHPLFRQADAHIYEFGIYYRLFDTIFAVPPGVPRIAHFHNVTPPDLVADPIVRAALQRSLVQQHNLFQADEVACVSELNQRDLIALGIPRDKLSLLPLPPAHDLRWCREARLASQRCTFLYVGRLTRAKGILDLLHAARAVVKGSAASTRFVLAGSSRSAEADVLDQVLAAVDDGVVEFVASPSDEAVGHLYRDADVVVIPSHHEGYCIPVLEAFSAGCQVIGTDAGSLPATMNELGLVVPVQDVDALAAAMFCHIAEHGAPVALTSAGPIALPQWLTRVDAHLLNHDRDAFRRRFIDLLSRSLASSPWSSTWLAGVERVPA